MKGPMKGATIGHSKQRIQSGRYIGITEPGIIAAEPPNPIVNHLVIMPDIEKRLEAFARVAHGIVVFPGGAGTAEEMLYLLGILLDPANAAQPFSGDLHGAAESADYFEQINRFIGTTLGAEAQKRYRIMTGDPAGTAAPWCAARKRCANGGASRTTRTTSTGCCAFRPSSRCHSRLLTKACARSSCEPISRCTSERRTCGGSSRELWPGTSRKLAYAPSKNMGPSRSVAIARIVAALDGLLAGFVAERRMKIANGHYQPCYRLVS